MESRFSLRSITRNYILLLQHRTSREDLHQRYRRSLHNNQNGLHHPSSLVVSLPRMDSRDISNTTRIGMLMSGFIICNMFIICLSIMVIFAIIRGKSQTSCYFYTRLLFILPLGILMLVMIYYFGFKYHWAGLMWWFFYHVMFFFLQVNVFFHTKIINRARDQNLMELV